MGSNFLPPIHTHENKGRFGNLCILPSLFLPTTCPITKPALLHLTAACGKTFFLSLLSCSSRLKNATFLFLLPRSCQQLFSNVQSPCERWSRGGDPLGTWLWKQELPRAGGQASSILTWDSSMARTHPVWMEQQLPALVQQCQGHWESAGVTQALSTAHSSTGP